MEKENYFDTSITTYATYEDYLEAQKGYGFHPLSREEWERLWSPKTDPKRTA